jgi:hypothetical protein
MNPSGPFALVQLVSEQTMPNVLAALALEPAHITLLHTPRTAAHAASINGALRRAGLEFEVDLRTLSAAPDVQESGARIRTACEDVTASGLTPVVNITGGTKLMSIGAFAATIGPGWPSLYVDSENRRFLQVGNTMLPDPLRDGWAALTRAERRLNVDVVAAAHGCEHVSAGEDPTPFVDLAEHLRTHPSDETRCHAAFKRVVTRGRPTALLETLDTRFSELPSGVVERALAAGLLEKRGSDHFLRCPSRAVIERALRDRVELGEIYDAVRPLQFAHAFLCGGWWEVCVWHAAKLSGAFRDLRWSVRFGSSTDHLEEDLVGVSGLNLAVFSCKRGGDGGRLNRAFEEFVSASTRLGGTFSEKIFCVAMPIKETHFSAVRAEAARVRARIVGPASRLTPASILGG